jgi:diguanylate cyclase (GGDEF)-like protein/PAS domain S-box-containing protein
VKRLPWRALLACLASVVVAHFVLPDVGYQVAFPLMGLVTIACIIRGVRRHRPPGSEFWYGMCVCVSIFTVSFALRLFFPAQMGPDLSGLPHLPDYMDSVAFMVAIASMHRLGQLRDDSADPTTVIDSGILAGGFSTIAWLAQMMPVLADQTLPMSGKVLSLFTCALSIWLSFTSVRLMLTSSVKNSASAKLNTAALLAVAAELSAVDTRSISNELLIIGCVAFAMLAMSALDPAMKDLTQREPHARTRPVGEMKRIRLVLMTLALVIAPAALLFKRIVGAADLLVDTCLIVSWVTTTALVMMRLAGLVQARERVARSERTLSRAASALVSCNSVVETYDCAVSATVELASDVEFEIQTIVTVESDSDESNEWIIKGTRSTSLAGAPLFSEHLLVNIVDAVRSDISTTELVDWNGRTIYVASAPLTVQGKVRGSLIVCAHERITGMLISSMRSLASSVSLSIEAAALARDLDQQRSERRFRSLIERSPDLIFVVGGEGSLTFMSPAAERLLGDGQGDFQSLLSALHPDDRKGVTSFVNSAQQGSPARSVEFRIDRNGTMRWFEATANNLMDDNEVKGVVVNARDISERKALENDLRHRVLHDDLTGIANRVLFRERLDHALSMRRSSDEPHVAALFIDIDDFKTVNDGLGHDVGDELLKVIAFRLASTIRGGDTAARLGGDEFAVLLERPESVEDIMSMANRLLEALVEPVEFGDRELTVSASIGVVIADQGESSEVVIRNADVAMYHAKRTGKNRVKLFDQRMYISAFKRLELKGELTHALERNELSLHYQPIVRLSDGSTNSFEALLRWTHPTQGLVGPASFIPLAEETGLIVPIGAWVLRTALAQVVSWRAELDGPVTMNVNLSPRQLDDDSIISVIEDALRYNGLPPSCLTLEVTESAGLNDHASRRRLQQLADMGCTIAADDFGTGFASYAALNELPFDVVKIDRSLIAGLSSGEERAYAQVRSIIEMAHALDMTITAEGVEDVRQADALVELGADFGQGFLYGRPTTPAEALEHVRTTVR